MKSLSASAAGLKNSFSFLNSGGGLVGLFGGVGLTAVIKGTVDGLDALNLSAERLGVSASKLDTLNFAGKLAGLESDDIEKALTKISVKLEEAAAGSKSAIAWFDKLGVAWRDSAGNVKTADKAFEDVSDRISEMQNGTGKVTTLVEGFGEKLGRKLGPALNEGAKGLKALREEVEQLGGGAYNLDKLAKQADEFNDNLDKLAFAANAAGRGIANEFLRSLLETSKAMIDLQKEGNTALAILRGFASLGKIPIDIVLGATKIDVSVAGQIGDLEKKLGGLQGKLENTTPNAGVVGNFLFGNRDDIQREITITKNQLETLKKYSDKLEFKPTEAPARPKTTVGGSIEKPEKTKKGKKEVDEAERLLATLRERAALNETDLQGVEKMTAVEKEAAKVKYQLEAGTLKATDAQKASILANFDQLAAQEKALAGQEEFRRALEGQESANSKSRKAMVEQTAALEESAKAYGLSEEAISSMVAARLEDAIAITSQTAGMEDQTKYLEEELALRNKLTGALEDNTLARLLANTESAKAQEDRRRRRHPRPRAVRRQDQPEGIRRSHRRHEGKHRRAGRVRQTGRAQHAGRDGRLLHQPDRARASRGWRRRSPRPCRRWSPRPAARNCSSCCSATSSTRPATSAACSATCSKASRAEASLPAGPARSAPLAVIRPAGGGRLLRLLRLHAGRHGFHAEKHRRHGDRPERFAVVDDEKHHQRAVVD